MSLIRTRAAKGTILEAFEGDANMKRQVTAVSDAYTAVIADNRDTLVVTGTTTVTLSTAADMLSQSDPGDYRLTVANVGSDTVTVARSGEDTIAGATSITLAPGDSITMHAVTGGYAVTAERRPSLYTPMSLFPAGTRMLFQQTTPPAGWTKVTSDVNGRALRVVSGTVGAGGTNSFTDAFNSANTSSASGTGNTGASGTGNTGAGGTGNTGSTVLTVNQIPAHSHTVLRSGVGAPPAEGLSAATSGAATEDIIGETGGGEGHTHTGPSHTHTGPSHTHTGPSHTHTVNLDVLYLDVIVAERAA